MFILSIIILILVAICNMALGFLVFLRDKSNRINVSFLVFTVAITSWAFTNYLTDNTHNIAVSLWSARAANFFALSSILLIWIFMSFFSGRQPAKTALPKLLLFAPVLVLSVTRFAVERITSITSAANEVLGSGYVIVVAFLIVGFIFMLRNMILGFRQSEDAKLRSSIRLMFYGTIITFVFAIFTNLILPIFVTSWAVSRLGPLFSLFLIGTISYGMVKHQLFDIRFFVVRAIAYSTTLFVITFVLIVPIFVLIDHIFGFQPDGAHFALMVLLSVFLLYLLQYIRQIFDKVTAKVFFRHYYEPQEVLDRLSDVLVRTAGITALQNDTVAILKDAVKPSMMRFILFADKSQEYRGYAETIESLCRTNAGNLIDSDEVSPSETQLLTVLQSKDIALAAKLRTTHEDLGYLVVGHKQSGESYTARDKRLLSVAADEIAISLQNALRFDEIKNFNVTLQQKVEKATGQLRRSNHRLRELDSTKDDFISMASHQLRTPLTSVKGYLSMVLDGDAGPLNEAQKKLLEQSYRSSQQMVYLISDLLNLSRLNTGKFIIEPTSVDLGLIVQNEVDQLRETAKARGLSLLYERPAQFPKLMLDETKIHQVVMNFIDNAIYYTPTGGSVTASLIETPKYVEYRVTDTGIGVPKASQHKLFTKFYRADNAQKARPDGTGLGLFMAKKVIAAQGGSIIFESEEGKGSTFGFRFNKARHAVPKT